MITEMHIDRLATAISLDDQFRTSFLVNRLEAVEEYNTGFACRFGSERIELNEEERQLVLSLKADTIEQVFVQLSEAIDNLAKPARKLQPVHSGLSSQERGSSAA